jgi:hypothetical protein
MDELRARKRECEDCGDEIEAPRRRIRCKHCMKLICGWCYNHVHGILWWNGVTTESAEVTLQTCRTSTGNVPVGLWHGDLQLSASDTTRRPSSHGSASGAEQIALAERFNYL